MFSQTIGPPSLAVGAGEVLYQKGQLDAELIASIISTKQDELKKELANRIILDRLERGSYTLWYYSKQTMDLLFNEQDKSIIKKEMLRNAVELMTVVAITEFYLRYENKQDGTNSSGIVNHFLENKTSQRPLKTILEENNRVLDDVFYKKLDSFNWFKPLNRCDIKADRREFRNDLYDYLPKNFELDSKEDKKMVKSINDSKRLSYKRIIKLLVKTNSRPKDNATDTTLSLFPNGNETFNKIKNEIKKQENNTYLQKPSIILRYNEIGSLTLSEKSKKQLALGNIILDMIFDICSKNSYFQSLGLFQRKIDLPERDYIDNYKQFVDHSSKFAILSNSIITSSSESDVKDFAKQLESTHKKIDALLKFTGQFTYAITKSGLDTKAFSCFDSINSSMQNLGITEQIRKPTQQSISKIMNKYHDSLKTQQSKIKRYVEKFTEMETCAKCDKSLINNFIQLYNVKGLLDESKSINTSYFIKEVIYPKTVKVQGSPNMRVLLTELNKFESLLDEYLKWQLLRQVIILVDDTSKYNILMGSIKNYAVKVIDVINALDQSESYEKAGKFIADMGYLNQCDVSRNITNSLINITDKYVTINQDSNSVNIDVESAFTDIYTKYVKRNSKYVSPYLSVGMNYNIVNNKLADQIFFMTDSTGQLEIDENGDMVIDTTIVDARKSSGFIGEKIGIKVKILDVARRTTYNSKVSDEAKSFKRYLSKTKKPFVNDIYFLAYGTGLLYQIDAINTNDSFDSPLLGIGFGVAFYNSMDFNINYTYPTDAQSFKSGFWNISFDIKLTEYLSELNKKRKEKQLTQ